MLDESRCLTLRQFMTAFSVLGQVSSSPDLPIRDEIIVEVRADKADEAKK